jgi:hypothetical protein
MGETVSSWSVEQVLAWASEFMPPAAVEKLRENEVDGTYNDRKKTDG